MQTEPNTLSVMSPFNGELVGTLPMSAADFPEQWLARAVALHGNYDKRLVVPRRIEILGQAVTLLTLEQNDFAELIAREGGKPLTDAKVEVARAIDGIQIAIDCLRTEAGEVIPFAANSMSAGRLGFTSKEPIGPVVAVSAFNHPLNLIVHQVVPAIAAGCPVVVKPSADTPLSCVKFVDLLHRAGLDAAWCTTCVTDDNALAQALVTDPRVAFFSFIGSAKVGWSLRSKLAPGTRCALEHGGAAPVIITPGAPRDAAIEALLKGGFYHAGQVCVSVQRVFVPAAEAHDFADALAEGASQLVVGDPLDANTQVGPLIRRGEVERVDAWVKEAVDEGALLLTGGAIPAAHPADGNFYAPTVLFNPATTSRVAKEEIFGPVVSVFPYESTDEAVAQANALPWAFQAAVFSAEIDPAIELASRLQASAVMINDHTAFRSDIMPFAGLRQSGLGVGGIPHTLHDMQVDKLVVVRSNAL